jgi:hypothetical protein
MVPAQPNGVESDPDGDFRTKANRIPDSTRVSPDENTGDSSMSIKIKKLNRSIQAALALGLFGAAGTASANSCTNSALQCVGESAGTILACAAAIAELGANPVADTACVAVGAATTGTCRAMAEDCPDTTRAGTVVSAGTLGAVAGQPAETFFCGNGTSISTYNRVNRVTGVRVRVAKIGALGNQLRVSSLLVTCASGIKNMIGNGGIDVVGETNTWRGTNCGKSRLAAGLQARAGNGILAVGNLCDYATRSSTDSDNTLTGLAPLTTGGNVGTGKCKEGAYLYGLKVWYDKAAPLSQRYLKGIELICRGY